MHSCLKHLTYCLLIALALPSCVQVDRPCYEKSNIPAAWKGTQEYLQDDKVSSEPEEQACSCTCIKWWESFNDPQLNYLIEEGFENNFDRKIAEARIFEARGLRQSAVGTLLPPINIATQASRGLNPTDAISQTQTIFEADFDTTFELDIFGKNRYRLLSTDFTIAQQIASYFDVTLTLTADIAREYIEWCALQQQLDLTAKTAEAQKSLFELNQVRFQAGIISDLDVSQAEALYKTTVAQLPEYSRQIVASKLRIAVLVGKMPNELELELMHRVPQAEELPMLHEPLCVISRRPDVQAAENLLISNTAIKKSTIAQLYPDITISGIFGRQNSNLSPSGLLWQIAGNTLTPLFDFGRIKGQIHVAEAKEMQSYYTFEKTILQAVADVETRLSDYAREKEKNKALIDAMTSNERVLSEALVRYNKGIVAFLDVLTAEQQVYSAQSNVINSQSALAKDIIALNKALANQ